MACQRVWWSNIFWIWSCLVSPAQMVQHEVCFYYILFDAWQYLIRQCKSLWSRINYSQQWALLYTHKISCNVCVLNVVRNVRFVIAFVCIWLFSIFVPLHVSLLLSLACQKIFILAQWHSILDHSPIHKQELKQCFYKIWL